MIFLYKTTNLLNGKFYYGIHTGPVAGESLAKTYFGSGNAMKAALKKHGRENFEREVLETFDDYDAAYTREAAVVTEELVANPQCYNLRVGGVGGFSEKARAASKAYHLGRKYPGRGKKIGDTLRGVKKTEEHKAALRKPKVMTTKTCQCGTIGAGANMTRYHFKNCKVTPWLA